MFYLLVTGLCQNISLRNKKDEVSHAKFLELQVFLVFLYLSIGSCFATPPSLPYHIVTPRLIAEAHRDEAISNPSSQCFHSTLPLFLPCPPCLPCASSVDLVVDLNRYRLTLVASLSLPSIPIYLTSNHDHRWFINSVQSQKKVLLRRGPAIL